MKRKKEKYQKKNKHFENENHKAKKKYGQNFLNDSNLSDEILDVANIDEETEVLEIGPGLGFLTEKLIENSKFLTAFEIDDDLIPFLNKKFENKQNFKLIHQDFMEADLKKFFEDKKNVKVVANIPYYITSPIINKLLEYRENIDEIYLMVQKEVAERMTAAVGTKAYGSLSVAIQLEMESEIAFIVPKNVFIPKPNVDSAVLKLTRRPAPLVQVNNKEAFQAFVQAGFKQRRKTLWNNLKSAYVPDLLSEDSLRQVFDQAGIEPNRRAESLSLMDFADLEAAFEAHKAKG